MGVLTSKGRKQVSEGNFALPGRRYPIHDMSHARNALARVSQHGTQEEQEQVRRRVHAKYPSLAKAAAEATEDEKYGKKALAKEMTRGAVSGALMGGMGGGLAKLVADRYSMHHQGGDFSDYDMLGNALAGALPAAAVGSLTGALQAKQSLKNRQLSEQSGKEFLRRHNELLDAIKELKGKTAEERKHRVPKYIEHKAQAIMRSGKPRSQSYAIAVGAAQREGNLRKGTMKLTRKGQATERRHQAGN